ncbi:MAG: hypothetical protein CI947_543 [Halanaerobium sp.]|jgi:hypothetical protein|nr:MAG: hypothetical protein CI949_1048 [Halanaerobium sp.]PUU94505.1 MAG: hypothetical protein CI947_543 [Halanaerobium sp.]
MLPVELKDKELIILFLKEGCSLAVAFFAILALKANFYILGGILND